MMKWTKRAWARGALTAVVATTISACAAEPIPREEPNASASASGDVETESFTDMLNFFYTPPKPPCEESNCPANMTYAQVCPAIVNPDAWWEYASVESICIDPTTAQAYPRCTPRACWSGQGGSPNVYIPTVTVPPPQPAPPEAQQASIGNAYVTMWALTFAACKVAGNTLGCQQKAAVACGTVFSGLPQTLDVCIKTTLSLCLSCTATGLVGSL